MKTAVPGVRIGLAARGEFRKPWIPACAGMTQMGAGGMTQMGAGGMTQMGAGMTR